MKRFHMNVTDLDRPIVLSHGQAGTYGDGVNEAGARTAGATETGACCGSEAAPRKNTACC